MKLPRCLFVVTLIAGLAAVGLASDVPQTTGGIPATQAGPPALKPVVAPDPAAGLADLPENQAELEAVRSGELKLVQPEGVVQEPAIEATRQARRAAFEAVMSDQNAKIQTLIDRLAGASGEAALALQKEIETEKRLTSRRLLEAQVELATSAGDLTGIENAQAALVAWDAPAPVAQPVDRPAPVNPGR